MRGGGKLSNPVRTSASVPLAPAGVDLNPREARRLAEQALTEAIEVTQCFTGVAALTTLASPLARA